MRFYRPLLLFVLLPFLAQVEAQSIDASSSVNFKVGNIGISNVKGTFSGMKGSVAFNPAEFANSKFSVCVDAATVNTGNKTRDKDLRSDGFFDVEKYPTICISSTMVEKTDTGFMAKGSLTMHGVTKEVEIPFSYSNKTFTGTFTLLRQDYGVGPGGTFMVGNEVEITIVCVTK